MRRLNEIKKKRNQLIGHILRQQSLLVTVTGRLSGRFELYGKTKITLHDGRYVLNLLFPIDKKK